MPPHVPAHRTLGPPLATPPRPPCCVFGGWENPGRVHQYAWVGQIENRLRPKMLSAYDWLRAPWAGPGKKSNAVAPPTHCRLVRSQKAPQQARGHRGGAGTTWRRGTGSEGGLEEDRSFAFQGFPQNPLITSFGVAALPSCPTRTLQLGQAPNFKQSYNTEKLGFTRNVGDYLLYKRTPQSTN